MSKLWIQTFSGRAWQLDDPKSADVHLADIAHPLSQLCRYTGHTYAHYSVAQHSCLVHERVCELVPGESKLALAALLHDAHEAYLGDMSAPLKWTFRSLGAGDAIRILERSHDEAIAEWAGIDPDLFYHPVIKQADLELLATERHWLLGDCPREWGPMPDPLGFGICPITAVESFGRFCDVFQAANEAIRLEDKSA